MCLPTYLSLYFSLPLFLSLTINPLIIWFESPIFILKFKTVNLNRLTCIFFIVHLRQYSNFSLVDFARWQFVFALFILCPSTFHSVLMLLGIFLYIRIFSLLFSCWVDDALWYIARCIKSRKGNDGWKGRIRWFSVLEATHCFLSEGQWVQVCIQPTATSWHLLQDKHLHTPFTPIIYRAVPLVAAAQRRRLGKGGERVG